MATERQRLVQQGVWPELVDDLDDATVNVVSGFLRTNASGMKPPPGEVFSAFRLTPLDDVRVVIIGEDPYPSQGVATGLAFSARTGIPAALSRIFDELQTDLGSNFTRPQSGDLTCWARNGVFLLNPVLTRGQSSHKGLVWEPMTRKAVELVGKRDSPIVFLFWGKEAWTYATLIRQPHLIRLAYHPSPRARGRFAGCRHFSQANRFLEKHGMTPIPWNCVT